MLGIMLGPIFYLEMLLGGRRGRQHYLRWFVGGILILQLIFFYIAYRKNFDETTRTLGVMPAMATSYFATSFVTWVLNQQYLIILLATPAFTAGAITDEKTRGTLMYLFSADLTAWEILVGKLLGRTFEVLVLLLATLPFVCFVGVWAGVTPLSLLAICLGLIAPLFAVGSASLLMSVWCRQTRDAVIGLFAIGGLLYLLWAGLKWLGALSPAVSGLTRITGYFEPLHVAGPAITGAPAREVVLHLIGAWLAWGSIGLVCFAVAVWRLRAAYLKQLEHSGKRSVGEWIVPNRAPVSDEPMLWKERHVDGIAPLAILKVVPRWFALPGIAMLTVALVITLISLSTGVGFATIAEWLLTLNIPALQRLPAEDVAAAFFVLGGIVLVLASFVVGVRCSGTVSGEREKQAWEALLLTPLATKQLIRTKLWGILGAAAPYVLAYMIPALILATLFSPAESWVMVAGVGVFTLILAGVFRKHLDSFRTFWVFFGIALVTMVASLALGAPTLFLVMLTTVVTTLTMFYMGAAGVWSSTRFTSSWRSLLATMGIGYLGGLILWLITTPITVMVALMLFLMFLALSQADQYFGTQTAQVFKSFTGGPIIAIFASCIVLAATFFGVPWLFIINAEKRVSEQERIKVWREGELRTPGRGKRRMRRLKTG
jgi:ABC-type transport system involved in multi-copper enzyme maturation permease subunit